MNIDLKGKKALVCGSTQGIGKATALRLAACGASVTLVARNEDSLRLVFSELETNDKQAHSFICADFDSSDVLIDKVTDFVNKNSPIHILVNNTGGPAPGLPLGNPPGFGFSFLVTLPWGSSLHSCLLAPVNVLQVSTRKPVDSTCQSKCWKLDRYPFRSYGVVGCRKVTSFSSCCASVQAAVVYVLNMFPHIPVVSLLCLYEGDPTLV